MDTEDLVRDALRVRAEQAPPPGHVLAALRRPRRSRKPMLLAVAAGTAVVAVAVVATTVGRPAAEAPPAGGGSTLPTTTTTTAPTATRTLGYSPTWVPDGMVERTRWFDPAQHTERGWRARVDSGQSGTPMLDLRIPYDGNAVQVLREEIANATGEARVMIGGRPASITDPAEDTTLPDARVVLNPEPGTYVELTLLNAPDVRATALRVAESLRPDTAPVRPPLSLGGSAAFEASADGTGNWGVSVTGQIGGAGYSATLTTSLPVDLKGGPTVTPVPATARGVTGEYIGERNGYLRLTLGPRQYLLVAGNGPATAPAEALIAAAEALVIDPDPDVAWANG
ncbi:MAG: hypothetical protein HOQ46_23755 [Saccharothrix sp.]|nr:hypothetical protein [Saccharothrix sp.]